MDVQLFVENDEEGYVSSVRDEEVTRVGGWNIFSRKIGVSE